MNGIAAHGGFIPYGATFLMFMEYARNAVRMAALMKIQTIFVYTHDSIGQGEDGPTHQPVEQLTALRTTPNLHTWRPADATESAVAWKCAIEYKTGPSALVFSRQEIGSFMRNENQVEAISRGGYVLLEAPGAPQAILISTGSEMDVTMQAALQLNAAGHRVRVVSMPSTSVFDLQEPDYKASVLPDHITARVAVESSHVDYWRKYVGLQGAVVGMSGFGESAPGPILLEHFGFTAEHIVAVVLQLILPG